MKTLFTFLLLSVFSLNLMAQDRDLNSVMKERNEFYFSFEINDLLEEYWWDEKQKADDWINKLKLTK